MVILYYADSLGLSRDGVVTLGQRYIYLFEQWLRENHPGEDIFIINRARRGNTVDQLYAMYTEDEEYIEGTKDLLIIHEGICDCAPRPVSARMRRFISKLPAFIRIRVVSYLHKNRARILKKGKPHFQVEPEQYEKVLKEWLSAAVKTCKKIILFTIAPTNEAIENHSPGLSASIKNYNEIMKRVAATFPQQVIVIDIYPLVSAQENIDEYITKEDGHHLTAKAHALYAAQLKQVAGEFL